MAIVAILVGAILIMFLGFVWFHPKAFGQSWMVGAGLSEADVKEANPVSMIGALLMAGVIAYAMSRYAGHTEPGMSQFVHGMFHGLMPGILYVAPVIVSKSLFEKKSIGWTLSNTAYWVLAFILVGGVVYALTPVTPK